MGRPPVQHHKHIISFDREAVDLITDIQETWLKGKAVRAVGEASEGILSNPALAPLILGGVLASLAPAVGKDLIETVSKYLAEAGTVFSPDADPAEKAQAARNMTTLLREILKSPISPLGGLIP